MTAEDQKAFEDEIYAFVGREVCPPTPARDDVNSAMIRQWTEIIGDSNPAYTDAAWAARSARGKTIAPRPFAHHQRPHRKPLRLQSLDDRNIAGNALFQDETAKKQHGNLMLS